MKIFNWVNRRFNYKANAKNGDFAADDKQFDADDTSKVLERWRGGILTIGTFGYDPLKDEAGEHINDIPCYFYQGEEEMELESSDYQSDHDDEMSDYSEEENPLAYEQQGLEDLMEMKMEEKRREELGYDYVMMEKKTRTTLADLFDADSEDVMRKLPLKKGGNAKEKPKCKHGVLLGKKLMLEDARPIHKLQKLIRRMLKRKIHPDITPINSCKVPVAKKCDIKDYASLLPTRDAII